MHASAPTHPGWEGTARPDSIGSVADLAAGYLAGLLEHGERDVVLIGSSIGGWIALEMAVQASGDDRYDGLLGAVVVIDGVGVVIEGEPIADFFSLDARGIAEIAWHDPERGYVDPAGLSDQQRAMQQANGATMAAIAGGMSDPTLGGCPHPRRVGRERPDRDPCLWAGSQPRHPRRPVRRDPGSRSPPPARGPRLDLGRHRRVPRTVLIGRWSAEPTVMCQHGTKHDAGGRKGTA
jgi:pimeloyl-ACP methyl ester carboxylesterase